ncbi:hypothetical protein J7E83_17810 [Arthrobacter sp. ISL-48]|uniref:hypothetical protein n=1 Tax=Arthrobacter sp. ISL-48 TaxID=2819110 RepID=UPI001BECBABB|nr:hypothetical protein [Arthrobacter sp. ISL-48]MBT2533947.1 hypothetical protein [Arthrobacter sp. ISL-48]
MLTAIITEATAPLPRDVMGPLVEPHAARLSQVLLEALTAFNRAADSSPAEFAQLGAAARGLLVADFVREPALRIFGGVWDAEVDLRHGYPWVSLNGGRIQIRFRKLGRDLSLSPSDSARSKMLSFHLGEPCLPGLEPATVLTAGYVLDETGIKPERLALVCHVGTVLHYAMDLPMIGAVQPAPEQIPVFPLSAPLIRSAQGAAKLRLPGLQGGSQ